MAQYQINESQFLSAVAGYTGGMDDPEHDERISWSNLGKLDELGFMMQAMLRNSMLLDGWNFELYPDPQIFLGTLKEGNSHD